MPETTAPTVEELEAFSRALAREEDKNRQLRESDRALRQALTWCVVNHGETLGDHPRLLERFREILGMEGESDG